MRMFEERKEVHMTEVKQAGGSEKLIVQGRERGKKRSSG